MASRKPTIDYYDILGVPKHAGRDEIVAAYRNRIVRIRDQPGAGEESRQVNLAYRALSNPERRQSYDEALGVRTAEPPDQLASDQESSPGAEPPMPPAPPPDGWDSDEPRAHHQEAWDEELDEPARRRRGPLMLLIAGLAVALLVAGAWASGLFDRETRLADGTSASGQLPAGGSSNGNVRGEEAAARRGPIGQIADAIASLAPGQRGNEDEAVTPTAPIAGAEGGAPASSNASSGAEPSNGTAAEEDPLAPGAVANAPAEPDAADEPEPPAVNQPEAAAPAQEPPAPDPQPPPAPRPQVDLSAGPRLLGGGLRDSDNRGGRFSGTVGVRLSVGVNGRAQGCRVTRSSGNAQLDATTCRLLQQRLFFSPARDRRGTPVASVVDSTHVWGSRPRR